MKDIKRFFQEIKDINYGWYDKKGNLHKKLKGENFVKLYRMQNIKSIKKNNHAICWEMCELEREYFSKRNIPYKTLFIILRREKGYPCHTLLTFNKNNKYYWFEASWDKKKGIHEYNTLEELYDYIKYNFQDFAGKDYDPEKIEIYEYKKPPLRLNCNLYYFYCMHSKRVK